MKNPLVALRTRLNKLDVATYNLCGRPFDERRAAATAKPPYQPAIDANTTVIALAAAAGCALALLLGSIPL